MSGGAEAGANHAGPGGHSSGCGEGPLEEMPRGHLTRHLAGALGAEERAWGPRGHVPSGETGLCVNVQTTGRDVFVSKSPLPCLNDSLNHQVETHVVFTPMCARGSDFRWAEAEEEEGQREACRCQPVAFYQVTAEPELSGPSGAREARSPTGVCGIKTRVRRGIHR